MQMCKHHSYQQQHKLGVVVRRKGRGGVMMAVAAAAPGHHDRCTAKPRGGVAEEGKHNPPKQTIRIPV